MAQLARHGTLDLGRGLGGDGEEGVARARPAVRECAGPVRGMPVRRLDRLEAGQGRRAPHRPAVHSPQARQRLVEGQQGPAGAAAGRRARPACGCGGHRRREGGRFVVDARRCRCARRARRSGRRPRLVPSRPIELRRVPTVDASRHPRVDPPGEDRTHPVEAHRRDRPPRRRRHPRQPVATAMS